MYLRRNRIFETGGKEEIPFSAWQKKKISLEKTMILHKIENKIWNEWTAEEEQQYLTFMKNIVTD